VRQWGEATLPSPDFEEIPGLVLVPPQYIWPDVARMVSEKWCSDVLQHEQMWNDVYGGKTFSLFCKEGKGMPPGEMEAEC